MFTACAQLKHQFNEALPHSTIQSALLQETKESRAAELQRLLLVGRNPVCLLCRTTALALDPA